MILIIPLILRYVGEENISGILIKRLMVKEKNSKVRLYEMVKKMKITFENSISISLLIFCFDKPMVYKLRMYI